MSHTIDSFKIKTHQTPVATTSDAKKNFLNVFYDDLCGESLFIQCTNSVIKDAEAYLDKRLAEYKLTSITSKLAIVLDVDETSLSNYFSIKKDNFLNEAEQINKRYHTTDSPAIKPVLRFFQKAVASNINVFFITARKPLSSNPEDNLRPYVIDNLQKVGYNGWTRLFMPQMEEFNLPTASFKTNIRKMLTEQGYKIILNIGDQDSDLEGGYAERTVKIPNFLYGTAATPTTRASMCNTSHAFFFKQNERWNQVNTNDNALESGNEVSQHF